MKRELNIFELASVRANFINQVEKELLRMDVFFQNHLWDGFTENSDKFISDEDFEAIQALTNKMKHMILNIGCPNSVYPMLESICTRKLKRWQGNDVIQTDTHVENVWVVDKLTTKNVVIGFKKGKQLKTNQQLARVKKSKGYYSENGLVLVGHFRWNNRGYILSRRCTEVLEQFILENYHI